MLEEVPEPGEYGDGPAYVRIDRRAAGSRWPAPLFRNRIDEFGFRDDPRHDYVGAHNSHSAFVHRSWIAQEGVPVSALSVVRRARSEGRGVSPW